MQPIVTIERHIIEQEREHPGATGVFSALLYDFGIGSLVADFHSSLMDGGVYYCPLDTRDPAKPHGKLRLLCEAIPLSFIAEQAGGRGSDGVQNVLDIEPRSLHQRTPLYIGNRPLVEKAEKFISRMDLV